MKDRRRLDDTGKLKPEVEPEVKYKVVPRHEWVLVRQMRKKEEVTAGGVVKPGADFFLSKGEEKSQRGVIEAAGPKSDLQEGDFVVFTNYPMEIQGLKELLGRDDLFLIRDEEVYAYVRPQ